MPIVARLFLVLALLLPMDAHAACDGSDLRAALDEAQRAELAARLDEIPYPEGNHWIARQAGDVVHLVGTVHLEDPRLDAPAERLRPVVAGAGRVLLEMTASEEAALKRALVARPEMLLLTETTLPELMDEPDWQRLAEAARDRGLPAIMAAKFQPWYLAMLLSVPACATDQMAGARGLDKRVEAMAVQAGVPTASLEPFETAFEVFAAAPIDTQIAMVEASLFPPDSAEDQFTTLLAGYFEEAHAETWQVTRILASQLSALDREQTDPVFDTMERGLLAERNHAWIPVILDALAETDAPVVAAFGAAHLHGTEGVLNLLAQEGFTLERAAF